MAECIHQNHFKSLCDSSRSRTRAIDICRQSDSASGIVDTRTILGIIAAFQLKPLQGSVYILIRLSKFAAAYLFSNPDAPLRLSPFVKANAASKAAHIINTLIAPTKTAVQSKAPKTTATPVPGRYSTFLAGLLRFVYLICRPEQTVWPTVVTCRRTLKTSGGLRSMSATITRRIIIATASSSELGLVVTQTTH